VFDECGLALAQLHGEETPTFCESLGRPVLRALRLRDRGSLLALAEYKNRSNRRLGFGP
jgi:phosphoribosylanthranilate isomerase